MSGHLSRLLESAQALPPGAAVPSRPVSLHIERLSLVGLPFSAAESRLIGHAAQRELGRLAGAYAWPREAIGRATPAAPAAALHVAPGMPPSRIGRDLARCVFAAVKALR
jgi:hypothetical protein